MKRQCKDCFDFRPFAIGGPYGFCDKSHERLEIRKNDIGEPVEYVQYKTCWATDVCHLGLEPSKER